MGLKRIFKDILFHGGVGPSTGLLPFKILGTDENNNAVYYTAPFTQFIERVTPLLHQTANNFTEYLSLSTSIPETGQYKISWNYAWSINNTTADFRARVQLDGADLVTEHRQEAKDAAGTGITVPNSTGGNTNTGTDQRYRTSGFKILTLNVNDTNSIDLDFCASGANLEPTIYDATICIERIP